MFFGGGGFPFFGGDEGHGKSHHIFTFVLVISCSITGRQRERDTDTTKLYTVLGVPKGAS
jgi:hypothetical protein